MKIGIYGGTFNPPHLGHITAAREAFSLLRLDRLLLIPAGMPPHKELPEDTPTAEQRQEMTRLAGEQTGLGDRVEVLDLELQRDGKSYTADTLEELKKRYPDDDLWLLMGSDMFLSLQTWHQPEKVLALAGIAAFSRTEDNMEAQFSAQLSAIYHQYPAARVEILSIPGVIEVSSTQLREQLALGHGGSFLAPAVYGYILREHLYGTNLDLKYKRMSHVLGVEQEAIHLAELYGADVQKARIGALLHDCTKKLEMDEQMELCRHYGIELDELEQKALKLLHAKTGAEIARDIFGVDDEIYRSIWWHTTGHANMTLLEKIVYLADCIEPCRAYPTVDQLREASYRDLDEGLYQALQRSIDRMEAMGNPVHHATIEARDALKG